MAFITGTATADLLFGTGTADRIGGLGGNDTLIGAGGNDTLDGGFGADLMSGGAGNDVYVVNAASDVVIEQPGEGFDTVRASTNWTLGPEFERLVLTGGAAIDGTGNLLDNLLAGNSGANRLNGVGGDDTLTGAGGADTLNGGAGDDTMIGGLGDDTYIVDSVLDRITEAEGRGTDTVRASAAHTLALHVEHLLLVGAGRSGTGNLHANAITGTGGNDTLRGYGGDDTLVGGGGDDLLDGGAGDDLFYPGGAGRDTLNGGAGDDYLDGGGGADVLRGGAGDDVLNFDTNDVRVDGGIGTDALIIDYPGRVLNLSAWAGSRLTSIENITFSYPDGNTVVLSAADIHALSGTDSKLRMTGLPGDVVIAGGGWTRIETLDVGNRDYFHYTKDGAILQVDSEMDRRGIDTLGTIGLARLNGINGFMLTGEGVEDDFGRVVSLAGDVNGDGYDDLIVGAFNAGEVATEAGRAYVIFGGTGIPRTLAVSTLNGANGFRLDGIDEGDRAGWDVAAAGDVNGDGYSDLLVSALFGDAGGEQSGESYVVFGASAPASSFALSSLDGGNGFRLDGINPGDLSGDRVATAGDMNGDGYDDLLIAASSADGDTSQSGEIYVVFGGAVFGSSFALSALDGINGYRLEGVASGVNSNLSVSSAGDVNGDGYADVLIGANRAGSSGEAYLVFGGTAFASSLSLSALDGTNGVAIGGYVSWEFGRAVSGVGDVNGDGLADIVVGAPYADVSGSNSGATYVVFGTTGFASRLEIGGFDGINGFRIDGDNLSDHSGWAVSAAGDFNGDGYDDVLVGAYRADAGRRNSGAGESYVVFGGPGFAPVLSLSGLDGTNGVRIEGIDYLDRSGQSVSGAGDLNGDGYDDVLIGMSRFLPYSGLGESYVVYGGDFSGAVDFRGTGGPDTLTGTAADEVFVGGRGRDTMHGGGGADVFRGGMGNDVIHVSDVAFFDIDGGTGIDTLALTGGGLHLDLTALADSKTTGIEVLDLTGSGANALTLKLTDLLNLSDTSNTLTVKGNADDAVTVTTGTWTDGGVVGAYHVYTLGAVMLKIDTDIASVVIAT